MKIFSSKFSRLLAALTIVCSVALGLYFWKFRQGGRDRDLTEVSVIRKDVIHSMEITGKFIPSASTVITPRQSGRIIAIFVKEGQQVQPGERLFSMRLEAEGQSDLLQKRGDVKRFELDVQGLSKRLEEKRPIKELLGSETVAKEENDLEKLKLDLAVAKERLAVLESELGLNKINTAKPSSSDAENNKKPSHLTHGSKAKGESAGDLVYVTSPDQGIVTLIDKRPGDFIAGGAAPDAANSSRMVMIIADMRSLQVRTRVMESDLRYVHKDLPVRVHLDAYPDAVYYGRVTQLGGQGRVDPKADYTYFDVYVSLDQQDGRVLPEMNAAIELMFASKKQTLALPVSAVAIFPDRAFVRVLDTSEKLGYREIPVEVGIVNESDVEILSGLKEGDKVLEIDFATLDLYPAGSKGPAGMGGKRAPVSKGSATQS